jgi:hypothetical protein
MNAKSVLKYASEQGAKFLSARLRNLPGSWQHLLFPSANSRKIRSKMALVLTRHPFAAGRRFMNRTCC